MARGGDSATSLAPGFRFHPTDEELIRFYLKRKVTNKPFRFDPISVIDIYKSEPWDLPGMSRLKSRDLEWYFFSALDKKYSNGSKTNRATEKGYWKTTGKDRPIRCGSKTFGMKKTLVYHLGRAPRGERSNWVMHEYRLADEELERSGIVQDSFVLCRVFQKSGTGPKNGEQYGAPFIEEEWNDDDEVAFLPLPCEEMVVAIDEVAGTDDVYVEQNDLEKKCVTEIAPENPALPLNIYHGDSSNYVEHTGNFNEDDIKPMIGSVEARYCSDYPKDQVDLPGQHEIEAKLVEDQYIADSSNNVNDACVNYLLEEPYLDASDNLPFDEGFFFEANDLSNPVEPESAADSTGFDMLDDYLNFFDADDDNMTLDLSDILESKFPDPEQEPLLLKDGNEGAEEVSMANQRLSDQQGDTDASSSKQKPEATKFEPDVKYPFLKQASYMLGGIPAPSALASEFPIKDGALRLNSAQASSSIHVTAGMIRIESLTLGGNSMDWSFGKNGTINIILSFGMSQGDNANTSSLVPMGSVISSKTVSLVSRCWFLLMLFWVLILSVSYKIGSHICTK